MPNSESVLTRHGAIASLLMFLLTLVLAAAAAGCGGSNETLVTRRDDLRARTTKIDPRNRLDGTDRNKPAWVNPGVYLHDDLTYKYFVELRTASKNVPMKLRAGTLIISGDRVRLTDCTSVKENSEESEKTGAVLFFESMECPVDKDMFRRLGKSEEVRVKLLGEESDRMAVFSKKNLKRFDTFYKFIEQKAKESERDRR